MYASLTRTLCLVAFFAMGIRYAPADDETREAKREPLEPQSVCPITGSAIDPDLYVDALGQRIRVCCAGCRPLVKKDPEKALAKLQEKGQYAESRQQTCPVMKNAINEELFVEYEGRRIYVCCPPCIEKVKADPARYAALVAEPAGEAEADAPLQTTCPIMGGPVNKDLFADVKGFRVYVCCRPCLQKVKADPEAALKAIRKKGQRPHPAPATEAAEGEGHEDE